MSDGQWYVSDPDNGVTVFDSEAEAHAEAEVILAQFANASPDGWHENMEDLHWGQLLPSQVATQVNERKAPSGSEFDTLCEYVLSDDATVSERDKLIDVLRASIVAAIVDLEGGRQEDALKALRAGIMAKVPS